MQAFIRARWRCEKCGLETAGRGPFPGVLQLHHRIPLQDGGSDALENLQALCDPCHRGKHPSVPLFHCTQPCANCPYRTDAPRALWDREEFRRLLETETEEDPAAGAALGAVYACHKQNGSICVGWLMDQDRRHLPSIRLRMALLQEEVGAGYLDRLRSPAPLYPSVQAMVRANFPDLLEERDDDATEDSAGEHLARGGHGAGRRRSR